MVSRDGKNFGSQNRIDHLAGGIYLRTNQWKIKLTVPSYWELYIGYCPHAVKAGLFSNNIDIHSPEHDPNYRL